MSKLSLEVGKTYINRKGDRITINRHITTDDLKTNLGQGSYDVGFRFVDTSGEFYRPDGRWGWGDATVASNDLVSVIDPNEGETLGDILGAALKARDDKRTATAIRVEKAHDEILAELGYIAAKGLTIRCVKIYRTIYGVDLGEAKTKVQEAAATARRLYHFG